MPDLPIVGITLGDVAGIGPEVVARALESVDIRAACRPLVIGDRRVLDDARFAAKGLRYRAVEDIGQVDWSALQSDVVMLLDLHNLDPRDITLGRISPIAGRAAVEFVLKATALALEGAIDAVATAPLNKEAMRLAGYDYIGHTEILADVTHTSRCTTMLATPGLRVTHVTRHIPFSEIAASITEEAVLDTIVLTHEGMQTLGYAHPRLAVAGLNPHNGDGGLIGNEESTSIAPAVRAAVERGIDARGPIPADSVFFQAIRGDFDAVVTMYHDQGHIAVKTHGFDKSITITLGLPIIRTSADHGTAFDIAGRGIASGASMAAAIMEAAQMAERRRSN